MEGYNGRLDAIQAGILRLKLRHLAKWNNQRRERAQHYDQLLSTVDGIKTPFVPASSRPVYHLYVLQLTDRDRVQRALGEVGIGTGIHYPIPLHLSNAYKTFGFKAGAYPVAERAALRILSLPMYPQLSREKQSQVVTAVRRFMTARDTAGVSVNECLETVPQRDAFCGSSIRGG
jgi:dTDP-4-amino-4,6-dideoxygalactose transaminase